MQYNNCMTNQATAVVNIKSGAQFDVYIGRRVGSTYPESPYANPFHIGPDGTREDVLRKYVDYLLHRPWLMMKVRHELKGKVLGCWCAPLACHGHILARLADTGYLGFELKM